MSSIFKCQKDIRRYETLKSNINSIVYKLNLIVNDENNLSNKIKGIYQVNDDFTPIVSKNISLKNNINSTINYLKNTIIPAIDATIRQLKKEIESLERLEQHI